MTSPRPVAADPLFRRILWALGLGVLTGIFFGEAVRPLHIVADGFIRLLQVNVLPYLLGSLIASLGSRGSSELGAMARQAGGLLGLVWILVLALVVLCPLALPPTSGLSFFGVSEPPAPIDWLDLYIPANVFRALSDNLIPAVVLFGILAGVSLGQMQGERKQTLLAVLEAFNEAMARASRIILRLTPIGLFAIAATTAGELRVEDVLRLQVWLYFYAIGALLVSFWILPGLLSLLTPVRYRQFLHATRNAAITAAAAGDVVVVLPLIMEACKELLRETGAPTEQSDRAVSVSVPLLYNFPHAGKVLSLAFLPFAAWLSGNALSLNQLGLLSTAGLLSLFGSINSAVPFLLDILHLPSDLFELFTLSSVVNTRFGSLTAAMHASALGVLVSAAMIGQLRVDMRRVVRFAVITLALIVAFLGGTRAIFTWLLPPVQSGLGTLSSFALRPPLVQMTVDSSVAPSHAPQQGHRLQAIKARGVLRVGYFGDAIPWAFLNADNELVGFDIEAAHRLAARMELTLAFVPTTRSSVTTDLESGAIDILMSGFVATVARAERMELSRSYSSEHTGFLVLDYERDRFATLDALQRGKGMTVGAPNVEGSRELLAKIMPEATVRDYEVVENAIRDRSVDALMMTLERAFYWSRVHPEYAAVRPREMNVTTLTVYAMPPGELDLRNLVDLWIDTRRATGELDDAYEYWVRGHALQPRAPRWSVIRNVFGWQ